MKARTLIAAFATCSILLAGAGYLDAQQSRFDSEMLKQISEFTEAGPNGATLTLADITDFEWDTVYSFRASTSRFFYDKAFGESYRMSDESRTELTDDSVLLAFSLNGEVVREVVISPPLWLTGVEPVPHGKDTALTVISEDPGPYTALELGE